MSDADAARDALRAAWDDMLADLTRARDAIDSPELMPAPGNERNLAEGYRYLMGFAHSAIERAFFEDPRFPTFRHALQILNKGTIDNADAIYFMAPIDGRASHVVRGHVGDHRHWRGEPPASDGPKAPRYLIFETTDGCIAGDSGSLTELRPGVKVQTGRIDSRELQVDAAGRFEILLAPERPDGHTGNFLCTHRRTSRPHPDEPEGSPDRYACYVSGRQLFDDWEHEEPSALTITRIDAAATAPEPLDASFAAAQIRRLGSLVNGQMRFWNEFYTVLLETYGKQGAKSGDDESERFMPRNKFNEPNAASGATGGGQSTNIYAGGVWELDDDEALLIESRTVVEPDYRGMNLSNLWGESLDYANHQTSLTAHQAATDSDGAVRYVVAHRDPGVANWLDTTGHREGFLNPRWTYTEQPPREQWPTISARKIRFDEIRSELPDDVRTVTPAERDECIGIRREHVQRRFRVF